MHHAPQTPSEPPPIEEGHESSEIGLKGIIIFGVAFVLVSVVVELIMVGGMDLFKSEQVTKNLTKSALEKEDFQPPHPQLQPNTQADMVEFRRTDTQGLDELGWVNQKEGIARIPIDRALKIIAERGLPKAPLDPMPTPGSADPKKPVPPEESKKK